MTSSRHVWTGSKACSRAHNRCRASHRSRGPRRHRLKLKHKSPRVYQWRWGVPKASKALRHRCRTTRSRRPSAQASLRAHHFPRCSRDRPALFPLARKTTARWRCAGRIRLQVGGPSRLSRPWRTGTGRRRSTARPLRLACIASNASTVSNNISRTRLFLLSLHCSSRCNNRTSRQKTTTRRRSPRWASACATASHSKAQRPSLAFLATPTAAAAAPTDSAY